MGKYETLDGVIHQAAREILGDFDISEHEDRYGASQWRWTRTAGERRVGVILAARDTNGTTNRAVDLEVWAAAEEQDRFGRIRVAELFSVPIVAGAQERLLISVRVVLLAAKLRGEEIGFHELSNRYYRTS